MKSTLALSLVFAASVVGAQQPTQPTPPAAQVVPLEGIVAVVGDQPITRFALAEQVFARIQHGEIKAPVTRVDSVAADSSTLDEMVQDELLLQKAKDLKVTVEDADITPLVDRQVKQVRSSYPNETEFRNAIAQAGLGTPDEYRKYLMDQFRKQYTKEKLLRKLQQDGRIVPVNVTDAEVEAEFNREKPFLGPKPASVTWKQIVINPAPTAAAKAAARAKAESLLVQLNTGSDFDRLARKESMDLASKDVGGDLGWQRRGVMLPEFDRWLFGSPFQAALQPGQTSPVFETPYGFHIVRVDRVQTGEVRARQILIMPKVDSADVARTAKLADSVASLLKSGVPFDTLAKKYHDYAGKEETSLLTPWVRDSLPVQYQKGFLLRKAGDITTFQIPGASMRPDIPKFVVAQLLTVDEGGERTLGEARAFLRSDLALRGGVRRYVDSLKKQTYVSVRLNDVASQP
jgi:peptidyl-prolyl cis-trans isomerase SurA